MLVGVGGSGKQSLSRLAAFIGQLTVRQIAISSTYGINDFRSDLQAMYQRAGMAGDPTMFLFTDGQITDERVLVYLNDLLASGDIPDLYTSDEKDAIISDATPKCKVRSKSRAVAYRAHSCGVSLFCALANLSTHPSTFRCHPPFATVSH